jgi:hypothetical protein
MFYSCSSECTDCGKQNNKEQEQSRIKLILKSVNIDGFPYQIIEVDGVQYISSYKGGIYPLIKQKEDEQVTIESTYEEED